MGGMGSGHWYRRDSKPTVEGQRWIDSRRLAREGVIEPGVRRCGSLRWSDPVSGQARGSLDFMVDARANGTGTMQLKYTVMPRGLEQEKLDYHVRLVTTRPHLGGMRWWFICPLAVNDRPCRRRVAKLYGAGKYFGCRACHGLVYRSSQEAHQRDRIEGMLQRMWFAHGGLPDPATAAPAELFL